MSGLVRNDWGSFLNGDHSYNFKYKSEAPIPSPVPISEHPKKNKKAIMPSQMGGKRKSKYNTKKRRHSRHK